MWIVATEDDSEDNVSEKLLLVSSVLKPGLTTGVIYEVMASGQMNSYPQANPCNYRKEHHETCSMAC